MILQRPPEPPRGLALKVGLTSTSQHPAPRTLCRDLLAIARRRRALIARSGIFRVNQSRRCGRTTINTDFLADPGFCAIFSNAVSLLRSVETILPAIPPHRHALLKEPLGKNLSDGPSRDGRSFRRARRSRRIHPRATKPSQLPVMPLPIPFTEFPSSSPEVATCRTASGRKNGDTGGSAESHRHAQV